MSIDKCDILLHVMNTVTGNGKKGGREWWWLNGRAYKLTILMFLMVNSLYMSVNVLNSGTSGTPSFSNLETRNLQGSSARKSRCPTPF